MAWSCKSPKYADSLAGEKRRSTQERAKGKEERSRRVAETEEKEEVEDGREREGQRSAEEGESEKKNKGQGEMRNVILLRFCCNAQVAKRWCKAVLGSGCFSGTCLFP